MKISNAGRAQILVQALPYIQRLAGKTIVVKYGGNAMINEELKNAVMNDIVMMTGCWASTWCWCTAAGRKSTPC